MSVRILTGVVLEAAVWYGLHQGRRLLTIYERRILFGSAAVLALSFFAGIFLSFYQWDHGSPFDRSSWGTYNPVGRATYGPLAFAVILFPVTVPLAFVLALMIYIGLTKQKFWPLPLVGSLSVGLLWIWYLTTLWNFD